MAPCHSYFNLRHLNIKPCLQQPGDFKEQARIDSGETRANAEAMLSGIDFLNAAENHAIATGKSSFDMGASIASIVDVLIDVGDLIRIPLMEIRG